MRHTDRVRACYGIGGHRTDVRDSCARPYASDSMTALREAHAGQQSQQHPTNEYLFHTLFLHYVQYCSPPVEVFDDL
jgi:hypothetical protein